MTPTILASDTMFGNVVRSLLLITAGFLVWLVILRSKQARSAASPAGPDRGVARLAMVAHRAVIRCPYSPLAAADTSGTSPHVCLDPVKSRRFACKDEPRARHWTRPIGTPFPAGLWVGCGTVARAGRCRSDRAA